MASMSADSASENKPLPPLWVGVAVALLPPLGIFLLWRHPVLGKSDGWKKAAYAWGAIWLLLQVSSAFRDESATRQTENAAVEQATSSSSAKAQTTSSKGSANGAPAPAQRLLASKKSEVDEHYEAGWQEAFEGGRRWGQMRRQSPSEQLDEVIAEQVGALLSTLEQLEEIKDATGGAATDTYERARGRLDGFNAGLNE